MWLTATLYAPSYCVILRDLTNQILSASHKLEKQTLVKSFKVMIKSYFLSTEHKTVTE